MVDRCLGRGTDPAPGLAILVRSLENNRTAIPEGQHTSAITGPAVSDWGPAGGGSGGRYEPHRPGSPGRGQGQKERQRQRGRFGGDAPKLPPSPGLRRPRGANPNLVVPVALDRQGAARGRRPGLGRPTRGPGRRSVLTGTDILAAAPVAQAGSGAGKLGAPVRRAAQSPRDRSQRSRGSPRAPARSRLPDGPAAPARAAHAPAGAAPPPPVSSAGAALKARTPDPGIFLSAQRGWEAPAPLLTQPPLRAPSPACPPSLPMLPSPGCWAPALWSGRAPSPCIWRRLHTS